MDHSAFMERLELGLCEDHDISQYLLEHVVTRSERMFMAEMKIDIPMILNGRVRHDVYQQIYDMVEEWNDRIGETVIFTEGWL